MKVQSDQYNKDNGNLKTKDNANTRAIERIKKIGNKQGINYHIIDTTKMDNKQLETQIKKANKGFGNG